MAVASYGSATDSSGVVRILKDLDVAIEGRDVLIVEDIVDSGLTLQYLLRNLGSRDPASLEVCALLTKPERRKVDLPTRYVGFEIPDRFVIGYGLDYAERYRNLPFVAALEVGEPAQDPIGLPGKPTLVVRERWWPSSRVPMADGNGLPVWRLTSDGARHPGSSHEPFLQERRFPILIVVVLAFFASKLILAQLQQRAGAHLPDARLQEHPERRSQVGRSSRPRATSVEVKLKNKEKYEVGYVDQAAPELIGQLEKAERPLQRRIQQEQRAPLAARPTCCRSCSSSASGSSCINQVQGGGSKVMSFGKSRAKRLSADSPKITFRDVAGVDEAVEELHEIKEFLENPKKFQALGARIPTGVLLYGPPGTGKTLLARAVAGEAGVPFFSISGSDFVEMFVGVGASRVRDLFEQAKQNSPLHHLHGRDRRRRAPPRRRPRRRPRRARADAQPAARRDGRLRGEGQHHHDRGHQPARHPRPGAAAPRALRPPDRRRPPRPQGPREDPRGPHARQAAREGDRHRRARRPDPRLHRRRSLEPDQRGRAARRPAPASARSARKSSRRGSCA